MLGNDSSSSLTSDGFKLSPVKKKGIIKRSKTQILAFKFTFSNHPKLLLIGQQAKLERDGHILKLLKPCRISPLWDFRAISSDQPTVDWSRRSALSAAGPCEAARATAIVLSWAIRWTRTLAVPS